MPEATESRKIKVFLVEDHPLFRDQLRQLICKDLEMIVCGEADNVEQALTTMQEQRPDIAIVDITLRGSSGLELIKKLKAQESNIPVLVLSMHDELIYGERALRAGARGYITKYAASSEVKQAIRKVLDGEIYLSEGMTAQILQRLSGKGASLGAPVTELLTNRELEVFQLVGHGRNTHEIAQHLQLGEPTIDTYRARIKEKLRLKNSAELYHRATKWVTEQGT